MESVSEITTAFKKAPRILNNANYIILRSEFMGLLITVGNGMATISGLLFIFLVVWIFFSFIRSLIGGILKNKKISRSPKITADATVVAKRTDIPSNRRGSTTYFITFQLDGGYAIETDGNKTESLISIGNDRMEFNVFGEDFGVILEGDRGKLTFQETRFIGFKREF